MRILFISAIDFPYPLDRGARYHVHYWLKALSSDHDVDFLLVDPLPSARNRANTLSSAKVVNLGETPNCALPHRLMRKLRSAFCGIPAAAVIAMPRAAVQYVHQAVKEGRYDLAILWASPAAGYAPMLQGSVPTILSQLSVDAVNARDQRKRAGIWHPRWALEERVMRHFEAKTCRAATAICTVNREDAQEFVRRYHLTNLVRTIPLGVELGEFPRRLREPTRKVVGFVGRLDWGANEDAVNWLAREIAPKVLQAHPDASFRVIGPGGERLHEKYGGPQFQFTGYVASMREALADVAVGVVPVFSGTGTRLKLLELLSVGVPTVTTSLGAAGLDCVHREHVLIADGTDSFAGAVSELLSDAALRERLGQKGSDLAKQYSWDGIEEKVRLLVREAMLAAGKELTLQLGGRQSDSFKSQIGRRKILARQDK